MIRSSRYRSIASALALVAGMVGSAAWAGTIEGTAAYRERIALPPDAVFEAVLQDVSRADAPAAVLGRAKIEPAGQPPFRFTIDYDDAAVQAGRRYVVRATVTHQGRLLFTTDRAYPALDGSGMPLGVQLVSARRGQPRSVSAAGLPGLPASYEGVLPGAGGPVLWHLDLLPGGRYQLRMTHANRPEPNRYDDIGRWLRESASDRLVMRGGREAPIYFMPEPDGAALTRLDIAGQPIISTHGNRLRRLPQATPIEPRLALAGMFTYVADAASMVLCADGSKVPVAMEAGYKSLETAYLQTRRHAGETLLVDVEGVIVSRPSAETGQPPRRSLVVERFLNAWPRESCGTPLADSPLQGTYWKLVRLGESPVRIAERQREPHLILSTDQARVSGSGGCNRLTGAFELEGDKLRLQRMASTRMACAEAMDLEQRFLQSLENVERFRIAGSHLDMLDAAGARIARFEAVALR